MAEKVIFFSNLKKYFVFKKAEKIVLGRVAKEHKRGDDEQ